MNFESIKWGKHMNKKVQMLRGITIIAVIIIHTCSELRGGAVLIRPFVNFAVGMFIFLSGYLTKKKSEYEYRKMIVRRIKKVLIPYVVWSIILSILTGELSSLLCDLLFARSSHGIYYFTQLSHQQNWCGCLISQAK